MAKVEVVRCAMMRKDLSSGEVYSVSNGSRTIAQNLNYQEAWVVIPDGTIPESAGYPLVENYIKAMASRATAHIPVYIGQTMIVTREEGA